MNEQQMRERIEALKKEREEFVSQAQQRVAYLNGQIAMLEEMLQPVPQLVHSNGHQPEPVPEPQTDK